MKKLFILLLLPVVLIACSDSGEFPLIGEDEEIMKALRVKTKKAYLMNSQTYGEEKKDSILYSVIHFNDKGNLVEEIVYATDGLTIDTHKKYYYNDNEQEISAIFTYFPNNYRDRKTIVKREIKYDDKGHQKVVMLKGTKENKSISIDCDEKGNPITRITFNDDNEQIETEKYQYNENNKLQEWETKNSKGESIRYVYKYKKRKNIETVSYRNDKIVERIEYEFNPDEQLIKESSYAPDEQADYIVSYSYYDNGLKKDQIEDFPFFRNTVGEIYTTYHYIFHE
jgi:hypothetical protein